MVAFQILFLYNLRADELLSATVADILPGDRLVIHGAKGSNSSVIFLPGLALSFPTDSTSDPLEKIFPFSYNKLWGWGRKLGLSFGRTNGHNNIVTHISRYLTARAVCNKSGSSVAGEVLRHRSRKSVSHYLSKGGKSDG